MQQIYNPASVIQDHTIRSCGRRQYITMVPKARRSRCVPRWVRGHGQALWFYRKSHGILLHPS